MSVPGGLAWLRTRLWARKLPATSPLARRRFLLLHGNPSRGDHFDSNLEYLRTHGDVAFYDAPGFGRSPTRAGPLSLDVPVLAIHGRHDSVVPLEYGRRLFDLLAHQNPRNRFEAIEGGHNVHMCRPTVVHALLDTWLI